jgi:hypothetical protein
MMVWEVVNGNHQVFKQFSSEEEAQQWANQENERRAVQQRIDRELAKLEDDVNRLRLSILGF